MACNDSNCIGKLMTRAIQNTAQMLHAMEGGGWWRRELYGSAQPYAQALVKVFQHTLIVGNVGVGKTVGGSSLGSSPSSIPSILFERFDLHYTADLKGHHTHLVKWGTRTRLRQPNFQNSNRRSVAKVSITQPTPPTTPHPTDGGAVGAREPAPRPLVHGHQLLGGDVVQQPAGHDRGQAREEDER
jgi:hypothetical protein